MGLFQGLPHHALAVGSGTPKDLGPQRRDGQEPLIFPRRVVYNAAPASRAESRNRRARRLRPHHVVEHGLRHEQSNEKFHRPAADDAVSSHAARIIPLRGGRTTLIHLLTSFQGPTAP